MANLLAGKTASITGGSSGTGLAPAGRVASPNLILLILCAAVFMATLDQFIVNVAFDSIGHDFHSASIAGLSWILNAYTIIYGALLVPAGRLADRFGRKRGFLAGLALFTVASLGCAISGNLWMLVAWRCVQAVGAALLTPSSLGLLLTVMPPEIRGRSVRIWASAGALAGACGPVAGGLLVNVSWQLIFLLNLPIGVLTYLAAQRLVPNVHENHAAPMPDLLGGGILIAAIGALALGLVQAPAWGWTSEATLGCWLVAGVSLLLFLVRSSRHKAPIVELALFREGIFAWANISVLLLSVAFSAVLLSVVLFLQQAWHWSALRTGIALAPGPCLVPVFALLSQRLRGWWPGGIAAFGALMMAAGGLLLARLVPATPSYLLAVLPGWMLVGVGVGLCFPTAIASATAGLRPNQTSTGSAIVNMSRQIGSVLGTSILIVILGSPGAGTVTGRFVDGWMFTVFAALAGGVAALGIRSSRQPAG